MIKFFISWTECDPIFQIYDRDCKVILSPSLLTNQWSVKKWEKRPSELFIDSGAYSSNKYPSVADVLKEQHRVSEGWELEDKIYFAHPDIMIPSGTTYNEENKIIRSNMERAKEYFNLFHKSKIKGTPVGIIHASCEEDLLCSYYQLIDIGYKYFAIGSVSKRMKFEKEILENTLNVINDNDIWPVHIFGITLPLITNMRMFINITSFDTSTPIKLGYYGTVIYNNPFRRYIIKPNSHQTHRDKNFGFRFHLEEPIECSCPICSDNPLALIHSDAKTAKTNRIIHNYYQIKFAAERL